MVHQQAALIGREVEKFEFALPAACRMHGVLQIKVCSYQNVPGTLPYSDIFQAICKSL